MCCIILYTLCFDNAPNRFLVIAEGIAGLAVREYIQSKDYQGGN